MVALLIVLVVVALVVVGRKAFVVAPVAEALVIERLGGYHRTFSGELAILIPFVDRVRAKVTLREQAVGVPPQPVITQDLLVITIDTVVYCQVIDAQAAVYAVDNYSRKLSELTTTALRDVVGRMTVEQTLTSRDSIERELRWVVDNATQPWGVRVLRVQCRVGDLPQAIATDIARSTEFNGATATGSEELL